MVRDKLEAVEVGGGDFLSCGDGDAREYERAVGGEGGDDDFRHREGVRGRVACDEIRLGKGDRGILVGGVHDVVGGRRMLDCGDDIGDDFFRRDLGVGFGRSFDGAGG